MNRKLVVVGISFVLALVGAVAVVWGRTAVQRRTTVPAAHVSSSWVDSPGQVATRVAEAREHEEKGEKEAGEEREEHEEHGEHEESEGGRELRAEDAREVIVNFDKDTAGRVPKGVRVAETNGQGNLATWAVVKDNTAPSNPNAFGITRDPNHDGTFNLAVLKNTNYKDFKLSVAFKANTGKEDQGGGPIWRCKDENNYYICRANPLENNFRLYRVENGRRRQLQSANVNIPAGEWLTIEVRMVGDQIECVLNGKTRIQAQDDTFKDAGNIGLWTKADAATYFDDLKVTPAKGDEK